jgi:TonB-dependent SusC/RagA subfamily outer membrane receptor
MTVTLACENRPAITGRFPFRETAREFFAAPIPFAAIPFSSPREGVSMLQKCRGVFFAGTAALALLLAGPRTVQAQDAVIRGTVTSDRGEPVAGANVLVEELRIGVLTNGQGQYTVLVPGARVRGQQVVVRVRAIGFKPNSKAVTLTSGEQAVDLVLAYDVNLLEAIVVTGTQEATEAVKVPFTVSRVDAAQMPIPGSNPLTQLQGEVPGANIVSASGRPGAQASVLLDGHKMINASGRGQDPLYIVDGVIINGGLPDLNPQDIENVEVVKGAAGASLYGARAGNGVINITTKSGRRSLEGVKFGIRSEAGVSDRARLRSGTVYRARDGRDRLAVLRVRGWPADVRAHVRLVHRGLPDQQRSRRFLAAPEGHADRSRLDDWGTAAASAVPVASLAWNAVQCRQSAGDAEAVPREYRRPHRPVRQPDPVLRERVQPA